MGHVFNHNAEPLSIKVKCQNRQLGGEWRRDYIQYLRDFKSLLTLLLDIKIHIVLTFYTYLQRMFGYKTGFFFNLDYKLLKNTR